MEELNKIEGEEGLYITRKAKIMYEINEYSRYYSVKNMETKEIKVRGIDDDK